MAEIVRNLRSTTLSTAWGLLQRHEFELRRRSGDWQAQVRETYDRGDGAAILLCDRADGMVVLIRQFRFPAFYRGEPGYVIEACAGKLEGDDSQTCARKEALEETGYLVGAITQAFDCFMSPGSVTERLTLFIGEISGPPAATGGGLAHEGEDIEVLRLPFRTALDMVASGDIADAKTVMLLQYAALNRIFD